MKYRPILFQGAMVRALLNGTKTKTRRVVKKSECWPVSTVRATMLESRGTVMAVDAQRCTHGPEIKCPYGMPGDQLWVREAWRHIEGGAMYDSAGGVMDSCDPEIIYRASRPHFSGPWKPSIHMPRWASRITLEIVSVRIEQLGDISRKDAESEGVGLRRVSENDHRWIDYADKDGVRTFGDPRQSFWSLWKSINGSGSLDANPWVWVVEFKVVKP